ncbi:Asp-tRNA(Asn)/Glu-tRNA(Gln) amidotransferase subunit GatC [Legionella spiritensis]|uniref:Aspartyl/glutamyl-tRNA(Asn/Gln) amidotransferase subunit C n=1 Tax=Legionella spiritensis TaxID=452 RepID=A0A0W0Z6P6_LEGSP|nr:Asp-tRNA(Asn)/Glu-tRNA(Gln) amidotransferase subunit GatC [Legionella spiritensis]KTD64802.1 glutamyl/tRNA (Gln) amidotransferase subunit C [Legionella spiritensis]SNV40153.1 glutamyl/tRNA (Gln) amidotransferase subunit C [Legionella spiritensis]VEG90443.1 glutamyl/tRNA (Gln) amidotransferase subunit C [Legionella spiritensis]
MSISSEELNAIAELACLDTEEKDRLSLTAEINAIIDFVQQLRQMDTGKTAPLFHPFEQHQRLRNDEVTEGDCSAQLAEIAPLFDDGVYLVPKVIDSGK